MSKLKKERVDKIIVDQGLAKSRVQAQALIMAGNVCLGDQLIKKASETFLPSEKFRLKEGASPRYVSRGGEKLEGALKATGLDVRGLRVLDIGISTGGFTDCLLQHGAESVIGVDVGHGQLDFKLTKEPRLTAHEGINARQIPDSIVTHKVDLVVIDVSFISLTYVLSEAKRFLNSGGAILALIKPQFEVEKGQVGKGGIVKDPLLHSQVQEKIRGYVIQLGMKVEKIFPSPIEGTDGNKEFFIFARLP